jgi:hypothetical protein
LHISDFDFKNMSYRSYFPLRQANGYPFHAKSERLCQSSIKISYLFTILMLFNVATNFPIAKKKNPVIFTKCIYQL